MSFKRLDKRLPRRSRLFAAIVMLILFTASCTPGAQTRPPASSATAATEPMDAKIPEPTVPPATPTTSPPARNPLTGLEVADETLLDLPAVLVSISTFPVIARPQSGLSFAPYVFEFYITKGSTRFLAAFYGEFPEPENPPAGSCQVRREPFVQTGFILGNRVWLDENQNNLQDAWERGIGGVCINLYDPNGNLLTQTSTDSNGYYGFNVEEGEYFIEVERPDSMAFAQKNVEDEEKDSDVDQDSGWSDALYVASSHLSLDAGLILPSKPLPAPELPPARVGPVRSGRLIYRYLADTFESSCLIYAYASGEVLEQLPYCAFVDHNIQGGGYMLDVSEMIELANKRREPMVRQYYSAYTFTDDPPEGGVSAVNLRIYYAYLNQTGWVYDPLSQSWWRYVDEVNEKTAGILHPEIDRLTGRQLQFENVVVLFTEHDVISPTNLDIRLDRDRTGKALLFRDGRMYEIRWSVRAETPIQFQTGDGASFPLKPGKTWVAIVTPETTVTESKPGEWLVRFHEPTTSK
jgi:hypothetical protein